MSNDELVKLVNSFCNLAKLRLRLYPTTFTPAQYEEWILQARCYLRPQNPLMTKESSATIKKIQPKVCPQCDNPLRMKMAYSCLQCGDLQFKKKDDEAC